MNAIRYEKDGDGIVHLIFDRANANTNLMDEQFQYSFSAAVQQLEADNAENKITGVILRSAEDTFFSDGNFDKLRQVTPQTAATLFDSVQKIKMCMRQLETSGLPVVAAIAGSATGGGWELALCCHHRIAVHSDKIQLGCPAVGLGLMPGGGGTVRMTRLLGFDNAMPYLAEGKLFTPQQGLNTGLIDDLADNPEDLLQSARAWIKANPEATQPWDKKGYQIPGGKPNQQKFAQLLPLIPAVLKNKTRGCLPAPHAILNAAIEGLQVDFDTATRIETRYFTELAAGQIAKNMIGTFWYQLNQINREAGCGRESAAKKINHVGILGAGMMGAGIAYVCAVSGIEVTLKDVNQEIAEKGKGYSNDLLQKRLDRAQINEEQKAQTLALIRTTTQPQDLQACDLIIEAVFEDRDLKAAVTRETQALLASDAVFASNTSTLPITGLAQASTRADNFIGLHFFSPVDKMPLVEIICGDKTSDKTLAIACDFVRRIAKTPIVVNDSRGFFTSRVFTTFAMEGIAMLGEGIAAASIENAAFLSGFPVGPLAVTDEVTLSLTAKVRHQTIKDLAAQGKTYRAHPADAVVDRLLEQDRAGKAVAKGFYDYPQSAKKHLWAGLTEQFYRANAQIPLQDIKDRLLFIPAIETVRCLEENVLTSVREANIGSVMGIGYPTWTGGVIQFINQYGLNAFIARAQQLAQQYGDQFTPPKLLINTAARGDSFHDDD